MAAHECRKEEIIGSLRSQVGNLFEQMRDVRDGQKEVATMLFGVEGDPRGGFVAEMRDTVKAMGANVAAMSTSVSKLTDKRMGLREIVKVSIPVAITGAAAIVTVLLKG